MQYENYLARKRARFEGICGHVNIPYGTALTVQGGFIMWKGQQVCGITSQNAYSEKGYAPIYARDNFENCWKQYHSLGVNGVMDDLHMKFLELPTDAPEA